MITQQRAFWLAAFCALGLTTSLTAADPESKAGSNSELQISWKDNYLTIHGDHLPGKTVQIHYLEAYCRPGSTDRDWGKTVIGHKATLESTDQDGREIRITDRLTDGVIVKHVIKVVNDEIQFQLTAHNPTQVESQAHWAQPCIRLDKFTGTTRDDARKPFPAYIRKCFIFVDNKLTRLPTEPWAAKARYIPGQVYVPSDVDRNDVNPRPLSDIVPSNGLCGCFSSDEEMIFATAWEPYQELFQGVISCMHSDFRIGGLKPLETKQIRGRIYIVPADVEGLLTRYAKDFPPVRR